MSVHPRTLARQAEESAALAKRHPIRQFAPPDAKIVWEVLALLSRDRHGVVVAEAAYDVIAANAGLVSRNGKTVRRKVAAALRELPAVEARQGRCADYRAA